MLRNGHSCWSGCLRVSKKLTLQNSLPFKSLWTHNHFSQPHPPDIRTQKCFLKVIPTRREVGDRWQELFECMKIERITYFVRRIRKRILTIKFCKNNQVIIFQEASLSHLAVGYEVTPPPGYTSVAIARLIKSSSNWWFIPYYSSVTCKENHNIVQLKVLHDCSLHYSVKGDLCCKIKLRPEIPKHIPEKWQTKGARWSSGVVCMRILSLCKTTEIPQLLFHWELTKHKLPPHCHQLRVSSSVRMLSHQFVSTMG